MSTKAAGLIKHYLVVALEQQGAKLHSDCHAELDAIGDMLEDEMRAIARDEIREWASSQRQARTLIDTRERYGADEDGDKWELDF